MRLAQGAHEGVGLGTAFLRHVARCKVLVHVVDGAAPDPLGDFTAIANEVALFNPLLAHRAQVVALNKADLISEARASELVAALAALAGHGRVMAISARTGERIKELMLRTAKLAAASPPPPTYAESDPNVLRVDLSPASDAAADEVHSLVGARGVRFGIETDEAFPGQFRVVSQRLETMVAMTNWGYAEAADRFERVLEATGVLAALAAAGCKKGDLVMVGDVDFNYSPTVGGNAFVPLALLERDRRIATRAAEARAEGLGGKGGRHVARYIGFEGLEDSGVRGGWAGDEGAGKDGGSMGEDDEGYVFDPSDFVGGDEGGE